MIRRVGLLCLAMASTIHGQEVPSSVDAVGIVEATASIERFGPVVRIELGVPGELLAHARLVPGGEPAELWLLTRPVRPVAREEPCAVSGPALQLWRSHLDGSVPRLVRDDLPPDATGLQAIGGDGVAGTTLLLIRPGELSVIAGDGAAPTGTRFRLSDPDLPGWFGSDPLDPWLIVPGLARTRFYRAGSGAWNLAADVALHPDVRRGLLVVAPSVHPLGITADGRSFWATAPQAVGRQRLRLTRVEPQHGEEGERAVECWGRLPEPERLLEWTFVMLDGRPALVVTTTSAEKLGLFAEKRLRVLPLEPDRSRSGHPPWFAAQTRANLWQTATVLARDVDGDGHDDLLFAYWKGLSDSRVVLDTYLGDGHGGFRGAPRTTAFDVKDGDRSYVGYGDDLDGDGHDDLVLRTEERLLLFRGTTRAARGKRLVETEPSWDVPLGDCARSAAGSAEISVSLGGGGTNVAATPRGAGSPRVVGHSIEIGAPCGLTIVTPVD